MCTIVGLAKKMCFVSGFVFSANFNNHEGGRRGNMAHALAQWWHPVASSEAMEVLHRVMRPSSNSQLNLHGNQNHQQFACIFIIVNLLLVTTVANEYVMVNMKQNQFVLLIVWKLLLIYQCNMGAHRQRWLLYRPPFSTAVKLFIKNNSSTITSLTPEFDLAGTKNSCSEGFWLAKHKHTNIPTMMESVPPPAAWFCWLSVVQEGRCRRILAESINNRRK